MEEGLGMKERITDEGWKEWWVDAVFLFVQIQISYSRF